MMRAMGEGMRGEGKQEGMQEGKQDVKQSEKEADPLVRTVLLGIKLSHNKRDGRKLIIREMEEGMRSGGKQKGIQEGRKM